MGKREVPIFLFNGFLESGKTTMVRRMLENPELTNGQKILLLVCETGMEEYDAAWCEKKNVSLVEFEEEQDYMHADFADLDKRFAPACVIVEFNGMWNPETMLTVSYPKCWLIAQIMTLCNSETFTNYYTNMRQLTAGQMKLTDLVVYNRFSDSYDKFAFRSAAKAQNMRAQVIFEYPDGIIDAEFDASPFDLSKNTIEIKEEDFPTWYFDVMDHAEKYDGKIIKTLCRVAHLSDPQQKGFVMGRHVMTCCENDIQFMGVYCINDMNFEDESWMLLTGKVQAADASVYGEQPGELLPVLQVSKLEKAAAPEQEVLLL